MIPLPHWPPPPPRPHLTLTQMTLLESPHATHSFAPFSTLPTLYSSPTPPLSSPRLLLASLWQVTTLCPFLIWVFYFHFFLISYNLGQIPYLEDFFFLVHFNLICTKLSWISRMQFFPLLCSFWIYQDDKRRLWFYREGV